MNIQDYLDWRGDVPFQVSPFNEVDNLILSALAYTPFSTILQENESLSLAEVCERYFALHGETEDDALGLNALAPFLMKKMLKGQRFAEMYIVAPYAILDQEQSIQLTAVSFQLADESVYVAYSGTDLSLTGWKEDLFFSCFTGTDGQVLAAEYLQRHFKDTKKVLRIGGHSKGGHFALYAASQAPLALQERIQTVYTNDAPGFLKDFLSTEGYQAMRPKVRSFMPPESIVGHLMYTEVEPMFCESTAQGILQHNLYTWSVLPTRLKLSEEKPKEALKMLDRMFKGFLEETESEERERLISTLFSLAEDQGYEQLTDFKESPVQSLKELFSQYRSLSKEEQEEMKKLFKVLLGEAQDSLMDSLKKSWQSWNIFSQNKSLKE